MIVLTLENGTKITFTIDGPIAFRDNWFQNTTHNNGGWEVEESMDEIRILIMKARKNRIKFENSWGNNNEIRFKHTCISECNR